MNVNVITRVHWSFWLIGIFSLLWNAGGSANFATQMAMGPELYPKLSEGQLALIKDRPLWSTIGFGVGVVAALVGSVLMLFKKAFSLKLFILSLIGVAIAMAHGAMVVASGTAFSTTEVVTYFFGQSVLSVFLVWYASYAIRRGWLR